MSNMGTFEFNKQFTKHAPKYMSYQIGNHNGRQYVAIFDEDVDGEDIVDVYEEAIFIRWCNNSAEMNKAREAGIKFVKNLK